jgi:quercetin dioxygenase-like cupin family protein
MTTANESVIVSSGAFSCCSAPIVYVHHRDYPEAKTGGLSAVMAAEHLAYQLSRSFDHAPDHQRREAIRQALNEVQDFLAHHNPASHTACGVGAKGASVMAIPHAQPGEVIDVRPLGPALADATTTALVKTQSLEVIRLVIPRGKEIPTHTTRGEITVQCVEGQVAFTTGGVTQELGAGQLLYLRGQQPHSVRGIEHASLLVTITFPRDSPVGESRSIPDGMAP